MKKLLLLLVLLGGFTAFGQGTITGSLMDMDLGGPLPGANVIEAGTNNGSSPGPGAISIERNVGDRLVWLEGLSNDSESLPFPSCLLSVPAVGV